MGMPHPDLNETNKKNNQNIKSNSVNNKRREIKCHDKNLHLLKNYYVHDDGFDREVSSNWVMRNESSDCTDSASHNNLLIDDEM